MSEEVRDPYSGLAIRPTDNGLKDCDIEAPQTPGLLELNDDGFPVGWEAPDGNR